MARSSPTSPTPDLADAFFELETSMRSKPAASDNVSGMAVGQVSHPKVEASEKRSSMEHDVSESNFTRFLTDFKVDRNIDTKLRTSSRMSVSMLRLFSSVLDAGGSEDVTRKKRWAAIGRQFNPPANMTDLSYRTKQIFISNLHDLEVAFAAGKVDLNGILDEVPSPSSVHPLPWSDGHESSSTPRHSNIFGTEMKEEGKDEAEESEGSLGQVVGRGEDYTVYKMLVTEGGAEEALWYTIFAEYPGLNIEDIKIKCFSRGIVRLTLKNKILQGGTPSYLGHGASTSGSDGEGEQCSETVSVIKLPSRIGSASGKAFFTDLGQLYVRVRKGNELTQ